MTSKQDQSVSDNSTAIQSSGDVNYSAGISPAQMVEIIESVQKIVQVYTEQSKDIMEQRLESFRGGLLKEFSESGNGKTEAFSDPDFQAALLDAQKAVARSGDESLKDVLIYLVSQKSQYEKRDRLSLTLNDAIAKVGSIPEADLNMLTLIFLFKNVHHSGLSNLPSLAGFMSSAAVPLLSNVSKSDSAVSYLAAHGCVLAPDKIAIRMNALTILLKSYSSIIKKGATEGALRAKFDDYDVLVAMGLVINSPYGNDLKVFLHSGPNLESILVSLGIFGKYADDYNELTKDANPSVEEFKPVFALHLPVLNDLLETYDHPNIRDSRLTSIGIALAHANLAKGQFRDADLSEWIKP